MYEVEGDGGVGDGVACCCYGEGVVEEGDVG